MTFGILPPSMEIKLVGFVGIVAREMVRAQVNVLLQRLGGELIG